LRRIGVNGWVDIVAKMDEQNQWIMLKSPPPSFFFANFVAGESTRFCDNVGMVLGRQARENGRNDE
jgi:hypothetical protein